jgi:cytochrome P450
MSALAPAPLRFNPFDPQFRNDPYPTYHALRAHDPVHRAMGLWVVTGYHDVMAVLRNRQFISSLIPRQIEQQASRLGVAEYGGFLSLAEQSIVFTDNPAHSRLRRLVGQAFHPQRFAAYEAVIDDVAHELAQEFLQGEHFDGAAFAQQMPLRVMCRKLGIEPAMQAEVARWTHEIRFLLEPGLLKRADFAQVQTTLADYGAYLRTLAEERRQHPGEDLISELLAIRDGAEALRDDELIHACIMMFVAGNATTSGLIGNALAALADHPDQWALLLAEPALVPNAAAETMRWDTPLQQTKRLAAEDGMIGGTPVPAGQHVLLCLGAANRDPAVFSEPDRFDIKRGGAAHLGFGFGMHACLGGRVAEREAAAALLAVMETASSLTPGTGARTRQKNELIVRSYAELPLDFTRHG